MIVIFLVVDPFIPNIGWKCIPYKINNWVKVETSCVREVGGFSSYPKIFLDVVAWHESS